MSSTMSSYSRSVCSFDNESDLTVTNGEDDDYQNEKIVYYHQIEPTSWLATTSMSFLSLTYCATRIIITSPSRILRILTPSFFQIRLRTDTVEERTRTHTTAYLDGMRGLAAFSVFLCHLSYGTWDVKHVYEAGDPGENNSLLQLPIVRLIYTGPPMVNIFFVISGYALSYKPVRLMRAGRHEELLKVMTSSIFRRALRLFLPCFVSTFFVGCLCQLGYYKHTVEFAQNMRAISEDHAQTRSDAIFQLLDWGRQMLRFVNVFDWSLYAGSTALDPHLWTIPAEYRCSLALFLTHLLTARMSTRSRLSTLVGLMWWGSYWNRWDLIPFWAGAVLAELGHIQTPDRIAPDPECLAITSGLNVYRTCRSRPWIVFCACNFICGLYLASFPDADGHATPGYMHLNSLIPNSWTEKHRFWPMIAATQIAWSVTHLDSLKKVFNSSPIQYLGQISFPLYLVHGPIIHTLGYAMMQRVYAFTGTEDQTQLGTGFALVAVVVIFAVIWASDVFWRLVDRPSARFAKFLERQMLVC